MEETALVAEPITELTVRSRIYTVRGVHVMLAHDLADIYQVSTGVFNQAVKRNEERFPENFRFQLTKDELDEVITNCDNPDRYFIIDRKTLVHIGASLNYFGKKCFACSTFDPIDIPEMLAKLQI